MKTGIVFRIDGRSAIVLLTDGSFVSVKRRSDMKVGQTVPIPAVPKRRLPRFAVAACIAVMLMGGLGWRYLATSSVALISLDVNPSIELNVNRFDRILSAVALNEDGAQILAQANTENAAYQEALASILSAEGAGGYLTADADVVLTVYAQDAAVQAELLSRTQSVVDTQIAAYSDQIAAEYHAVDVNTVSDAHGHGVSAGKYLYLRELQGLMPAADISEYAHHSIEQIKGAIEACHEESGHEKHGNVGSDHCHH